MSHGILRHVPLVGPDGQRSRNMRNTHSVLIPLLPSTLSQGRLVCCRI